jgi:hypothetical protein
MDNHDVAQELFACDIHLCFEDLKEELFGVFESRSCNITHEQVLSKLQIINRLPTTKSSCHVSDLSCDSIDILENVYAGDISLHRRVCARKFLDNGDLINEAVMVKFAKLQKHCS